MFKKALAHQSNATPLRSSARRQLLASVYADYPVLRESIGAEGDETDGKWSEKDLGRLLIPDGIRITSIETSGGVGGVSMQTNMANGSLSTYLPMASHYG